MDGNQQRVPTRTVLGYGIGQLGAQIFRDTPAVLLPIFMTTMLGIPAWLAGIAILVPKLWVIICDPMVGVYSDRLKERRGRTPFLLVGAVLTSLGFLSLFLVTDYGAPGIAAAVICLLFFLASTGFSLFSVPYLAIASELSPDRHERTRILAYRMVATIGGVVIGVGVAQQLVFALGGGARGWHTMAISFSLICLATMLIPAIVLRRVPLLRGAQTPAHFRDQLGPVFRNRPYAVLLATTFVQGIGQASGYTVLGFFFLYALASVELIPAFIFSMMLGSLLSQPLFVTLSRRFGKERTYVMGSVLWTLVTISWYFVEQGGPALLTLPVIGDVTGQQLLVLCRGFFIGIVNTGFLLLSFSMLTDTIDYQRRKHGVAHEGVFSGIFSAAEKLAFAVGPLVAGLVMSAFGFRESTGGLIEQGSDAVLGIILLYSFIPAGTQVLSLLIFSRYRLDPSELEDRPTGVQPVTSLTPAG